MYKYSETSRGVAVCCSVGAATELRETLSQPSTNLIRCIRIQVETRFLSSKVNTLVHPVATTRVIVAAVTASGSVIAVAAAMCVVTTPAGRPVGVGALVSRRSIAVVVVGAIGGRVVAVAATICVATTGRAVSVSALITRRPITIVIVGTTGGSVVIVATTICVAARRAVGVGALVS